VAACCFNLHEDSCYLFLSESLTDVVRLEGFDELKATIDLIGTRTRVLLGVFIKEMALLNDPGVDVLSNPRYCTCAALALYGRASSICQYGSSLSVTAYS
jgi:hypothetical protein